ncbi:MAG: ferrous iron transport protein A [Alicyclobacillus sp.]|nr:ferrous iron transport protein A [Alicyclobacillus sp.]
MRLRTGGEARGESAPMHAKCSDCSVRAVCCLADLQVNTAARVASVEGHPAFRQRMLALGITPGSPVTVLRAMPLGGPMEIEVRGTRLAIRRDDAAGIRVATP